MASMNFGKIAQNALGAGLGGVVGGVVQSVIPSFSQDAKMNAIIKNSLLLLGGGFLSTQKNDMLKAAALGMAGVAGQGLLRDGLGFKIGGENEMYVAAENNMYVAAEQNAEAKKLAKQVADEMDVTFALKQLDEQIKQQELANVAGEMNKYYGNPAMKSPNSDYVEDELTKMLTI